jgi:hypothetical protein
LSLGSKNLLIITAVLAALLAAIYGPALGHGFVKDDYRWIAAAEAHSPADVARFFTTNVGFYRPLVTAAFALDRTVWHLDPRGYALTNALLLVADAGLLFVLARRLTLPPEAALFASAVWIFNFHGINMALLWMSGRTALLLCLFAQASALAFLARARWSAVACGAFALAAMSCKEEAVMLPLVFAAWTLLSARNGQTSRSAGAGSLPAWIALALYLLARSQSGAFSVSTAPDYYRLTFDPRLVLRNIAEYLDRGASLAALMSLVTWFATPRLPFSDGERRTIRCGVSWFVAMYAVTVFVPVRSSLYAVAPSLGSALVAGACAARAMRLAPRRFARVAAASLVVLALLVPVYRSRNHGLVEPADLAAQSLAAIQSSTPGNPDAQEIVLVDDPRAPITLDSAFGALFPDAVHLFVSPALRGRIIEERTGDIDRRAIVFELRDGYLGRISGTPADNSATHAG